MKHSLLVLSNVLFENLAKAACGFVKVQKQHYAGRQVSRSTYVGVFEGIDPEQGIYVPFTSTMFTREPLESKDKNQRGLVLYLCNFERRLVIVACVFLACSAVYLFYPLIYYLYIDPFINPFSLSFIN